MRNPRFRRRGGFSLIELLVVIAIITILVSVLMLSIQRARESANRINCVNNLRNIGIACHLYHDSTGSMPSEAPNDPNASGKGLFYDLAPFLEIATPPADPDKPAAYTIFLCPSRHRPDVGPYVDYGYVKTADPQYDTIFFPASRKPYTLGTLTNSGGTAFSILLSHVGLRPEEYNDPSATLKMWNAGPHYVSGGDSGFLQDSDNMPAGAIASPHPGSVPTLFADAHVSNLPTIIWGGRTAARMFEINPGVNKNPPPAP